MAIPDKLVRIELNRKMKRLKGSSETGASLWIMATNMIFLILLTITLTLSIRISDIKHISDSINQTLLRQIREVKTGDEHWLDHPDPPHPYANNMWWRLINHTAKINRLSNCYVCAQLPHSITGGDWWAYQDPDPDVVKYLATITVAAAGMPENSNLWIMENSTEWTTVKIVKRVAGRVATVKEIPKNMTCYQNDGGLEPMGNIPASYCEELYTTTAINKETEHQCMSCLLNTTISVGRLPQSMIVQSCYHFRTESFGFEKNVLKKAYICNCLFCKTENELSIMKIDY